MNSCRDIVITGIGVVSPIGVGQEQFWQALIDGTSGVCVRQRYADTELPFRIAAPVQGFEAKQYVKPRKALKIMCEPIQFACAAAAMAFEQANYDAGAISPDRIATIFGTETFFANPHEVQDAFRKCVVDKEFDHRRWDEMAMREIQPLWMLKYLPNMAASHIAIALDARGPSNSICQGEVSGLLALIEAADIIQRGAADVVLTGGTGSQMELSAILTRGSGPLSKRIHEPEQASRPFDRDRDGMVAGEGAGALVLESAEHAQARGATPLARLAGWSRTFQNPLDANFAVAIKQGFEATLRHANMSAGEIGLVNANASGSVRGDLIEAAAIEQVFSDEMPVVAHKGNFGNIGGGTSIVELIGAVLAIQYGIIPPSLNCDFVDPLCHVNVLTSKSTMKKGGILKSSFSSSGQISSIIVD